VPVHVVQRGIDRADCFFSEKDYVAYVGFLTEAAARFECSVHAYCLMTNHVHLLVTPHAAHSCAALMKHVGQCYVQRINMRLERKGTLWEGRFRSGLIASQHHLLACYRYIELNPVRAGLVRRPADYRWSSFRSNALGEATSLITPHAAYLSLAQTSQHRRHAYESLFDEPLAQDFIDDIRKATGGGRAIGAARTSR
jgi:putative transposase